MEGAFENIMHQGRRISGKLRISTTSEYGERFVLPLIPDFVAQHPGISVCYDVNASLSDLLAEKLDLVVRLGNLADSSFRSRKLAQYDIVLVASQAFLRQHPVRRPADLAAAPWIANSNLSHPTAWTLRSANGQRVDIADGPPTSPTHRPPSGPWRAPGWAWRCYPPGSSRTTWRAALRRILPGHALPQQPINVVFPNSGHLPRKTRAFIDYLCERLGEA